MSEFRSQLFLFNYEPLIKVICENIFQILAYNKYNQRTFTGKSKILDVFTPFLDHSIHT